MESLMSDNTKIGLGLILIGLFFYMLGIMWFLDRGFLCIGNISFIMGLIAMIGPKYALAFFAKKKSH